MVTKTIPSKPKPEAKEVDFSNEDTTLTPEQEKIAREKAKSLTKKLACLLYTSPSPRDNRVSRMPSSA